MPVIGRRQAELIFESSGKDMNGRIVQFIGDFCNGNVAGSKHVFCERKFFIDDIGRNIFPGDFFEKS